MDKPVKKSATIQGAVLAAISETIRAIALIASWSDTTLHAVLAIVTAWGLVWFVYGMRRAVGKGPGAGAPRGFVTMGALRALLVLALIVCLAGLALGGCATVKTGPGDNVEALLDVGPPYTLQGRINGKPKCTMTGIGELRLRGKPGQCMIVNPAGVWEKKPAGCIPKAPEGSGND